MYRYKSKFQKHLLRIKYANVIHSKMCMSYFCYLFYINSSILMKQRTGKLHRKFHERCLCT